MLKFVKTLTYAAENRKLISFYVFLCVLFYCKTLKARYPIFNVTHGHRNDFHKHFQMFIHLLLFSKVNSKVIFKFLIMEE